MIKFLFFTVFLFFLLVFLLGFSLLRGLKRLLFGDGRNRQQQAYRRRTDSRSQRASSAGPYAEEDEAGGVPRRKPRKKIYSRDEGEYVDFEEVK